mmetsp:Transcript_74495/g.177713  ORF Transcript_74495/g.177713 Transcript_74495/m.177713 type:complete len:327 (-) Transcript_74495:2265-3245(-)
MRKCRSATRRRLRVGSRHKARAALEEPARSDVESSPCDQLGGRKRRQSTWKSGCRWEHSSGRKHGSAVASASCTSSIRAVPWRGADIQSRSSASSALASCSVRALGTSGTSPAMICVSNGKSLASKMPGTAPAASTRRLPPSSGKPSKCIAHRMSSAASQCQDLCTASRAVALQSTSVCSSRHRRCLPRSRSTGFTWCFSSRRAFTWPSSSRKSARTCSSASQVCCSRDLGCCCRSQLSIWVVPSMDCDSTASEAARCCSSPRAASTACSSLSTRIWSADMAAAKMLSPTMPRSSCSRDMDDTALPVKLSSTLGCAQAELGLPTTI